MKNNLVVTAVVGLVALGAGFFGGMSYQQGKTPAVTRQFGGANGGQAGQNARRFGANGGNVFGQIVSLDDKSITVKLQDGSSKIVILADSTTYSKSTAGTKT